MSEKTETNVKTLSDVLAPGESGPDSADWQIRIFSHKECLAYLVWNQKNSEGFLIDPKRESVREYLSAIEKLSSILWLGVIDTHTHADHISAAAEMAGHLKAPLFMHHLAPSRRIDLRVSKQTYLSTRSGPMLLVPTPGHTADGICVQWGPFVFTGDTVLFGDVGRDDLPTGDPGEHHDSLQTLRKILPPSALVCPGHDSKGGRIASWATQLKMNSSITQDKESYVRECEASDYAPSIEFKRSLFENFK